MSLCMLVLLDGVILFLNVTAAISVCDMLLGKQTTMLPQNVSVLNIAAYFLSEKVDEIIQERQFLASHMEEIMIFLGSNVVQYKNTFD